MGVFALVSIAAFGVGCDDSPPDIACGNGAVEDGEQCDDSNTVSGDGCSAVCKNETAGECGDGTVNIGEQCDDSNMVSGDGCSMTCMNESAAVCGNMKKEAGEQCDDGNTTSGDGCSATCTNEGMMVCGDGTKDPGEACDDGNKISLDGCENNCTLSPGEIDCPALPATTNLCDVTAGDATKVISGDVLGASTIYRGGSVALDAMGKITCVGCDCATQNPTATKVVCPEAVISPGLINTHEHITFTQNQPYTDTGERYEQRHDWRKGKNGHTKLTSAGSASADQIRWGELRFLLSGATSLVGSGSATGFLRNLDKSEQEGLGIDPVDFDTFPLGDTDGQQLATGCGYPSIATTSEIAADTAYFPHIAEGIDAFAHNEFDCVDDDRMTHDLVQPQSAFIHAVGLTPVDYAMMAAGGTSLIWSPRSNVTLYGNTAVVTVAARAGVNIALGTDWIVSGSMNMQRELTCADELNSIYYDHIFSDGDLFRMVTVNAAKAIHAENDIGSLAVGLTGDIAIYDARVNADYRAIIDGEPKDVALVLRGGKPIYGAANVISGIPNSGACDAIDVCGEAKSLCSTSEVGKTFSALKTSAGNVYEAFFCGQPTKEPSCVPSRPKAVNMSTIYTGAITATDSDGDGIPNASDNCPNVFNPIRPMDNNMQPNVDGDADGDACDPCPLDPNTTTCSMIMGGDSDGDMIPDADDNCPNQANANQADADSDMKGDVCDACPNEANPGNNACTATIYDIKDGTIMSGSTVALKSQLVTGRAATGFFIQVKQGDPDYDAVNGANYSGIFVYLPGTMAQVGDRVDITTATVSDFFGQKQLVGANVMTVASNAEAPPTPVSVTPAMAAGAMATPLEGVIVTVPNVNVTDVAPMPGMGDMQPTNEFVVNSSLRVDDFFHLVSPFPIVGTPYTSISGILAFKNNNQKLEPRSAADYVSGNAIFVGFDQPSSFVRAGQTNVASIPDPLQVVMSSSVQMATFVPITATAGVTVVGGGVTVPAGQSTAPVLFSNGVQTPSVTLTGSLAGQMDTATVRVVGVAEQPVLSYLTPSMLSIGPGATGMFEVGLDIPAPAGGALVALGVTPMGAGMLPPNVTVLQDELAATFSFVDGSMVTSSSITATLGASMQTATITVSSCGATTPLISEIRSRGPLSANNEFVELYNPTSSPIVLDATWKLEARSSTAGAYGGRWTGTGKTIPAHGHFLIAFTGYTQMPVADEALTTGITDATSLRLVHNTTTVDAVCYAFDATSGMPFTAGGSTYTCEGAPNTSNPHDNSGGTNTDASLERKPGGVLGSCGDTMDSAADFQVIQPAQPQNSMSGPTP